MALTALPKPPTTQQITCPRCGGVQMEVRVGPGQTVEVWCAACRKHVPWRERRGGGRLL